VMACISYRRTAIPISIFVVLCALTAPQRMHAQGSQEQRQLLVLGATPIGALPPIALPMPASRNHNYWGFRLQGGHRDGPGGSDLPAVAAGVDFQYRGGSVIGLTAGYQKGDCELLGSDCGGHALFGVRSRINLMTGGQSIGSLLRDYSSTATLGGEVGFGYAPSVLPGVHACTIDVGVPVSISTGQRVRIATFVTPGMVWDMNCSGDEDGRHHSYLTGFGVGLQQFRNRGLDIYVGVQKIFRRDTGYQVGISVTYVILP
jgi:hypothetical protein